MADSIGMVGVGLLGGALAARLSAAGYSLMGFDIDADRRREFAEIGVVAESSEAVLRTCRTVVLCLPNSDCVEQVVEDAIADIPRKTCLVDTTTGDPERTAALGQRLVSRGVGYLDATVAGSSQQARTGDIVLMVGGRDADVNAQRDLLRAWTERIFHLGPCGAGAQMKLVVNLVLGLNRAALAEGLALAERCGLDAHRSLEVLKSGAAYSYAMDAKGQKMVERDFSPQARLAQHLKDVRLMLEMADRVGAWTPLAETHRTLLEAADKAGWGEADNSAVLSAFSLRPPEADDRSRDSNL
ncbi:MAG: NAD(P)-dependent oxidoreductase [Pirellulaceae bacterium]|jgi:3-hydroxyisobutyrate dehydrogenase-like beta-hydroxyacid dehydrogenase|nr:NAD(P)-dependent oxidoreductase [Pirellulaceae bacterium]